MVTFEFSLSVLEIKVQAMHLHRQQLYLYNEYLHQRNEVLTMYIKMKQLIYSVKYRFCFEISRT